MKLFRGFFKGLIQISVLSSLFFSGPGMVSARAASAAEFSMVFNDSVALPKPVLELVKNFISELVVVAELPVDQAREKGNQLLEKYFSSSLGSDYLMRSIFQSAASSRKNFAFDPVASLTSKSERAKQERALVQTFFREYACRLFLFIIRGIRDAEKAKLAETSIFLDEALRQNLLANPLTYSVADVGQEVVHSMNGSSSFHVRVKLIPEVDRYGESVAVTYVVRKGSKGDYFISDFQFGDGISARTMYVQVLKETVVSLSETSNWFSDFIYSKRVPRAMQEWGIDEAKWKKLATDFTMP